MNLQQLEYLKGIAETKSFTLAAEYAHVTQPALSKAISKLEEELGVTLIKRDVRDINLTEFGEIFLKHGKSALSSIKDGIKEIEDLKKKNENNIYISSTPCISASFIHFVISDFLNLYNGTKFQFSNESTKNILHNLNNNKIDIGFFESIENIEDFREVEFEKIKKEKYVLVVPKNYHLASKHEVSLKDLKDEFFIMVDEYKNKIVKYHEKIGYIPKILVQPKEAGVMGVLVLVAAGAGVTILPNTQMINVDKISILNIKEDIGYKTIYMGWNKHKSEVAIVKNFKEFVIKKYK